MDTTTRQARSYAPDFSAVYGNGLTLRARAVLSRRRVDRCIVLLLREAQERLEGELRRCEDGLAAVLRARARIQAACDEELVTALSHHLVATRLGEVSGIGIRDQADILSAVFDRNLGDLRSAYWVLGLTEGRASRRSTPDPRLPARRFPALLQDEISLEGRGDRTLPASARGA